MFRSVTLYSSIPVSLIFKTAVFPVNANTCSTLCSPSSLKAKTILGIFTLKKAALMKNKINSDQPTYVLNTIFFAIIEFPNSVMNKQGINAAKKALIIVQVGKLLRKASIGKPLVSIGHSEKIVQLGT